jgi:hypothetical protein
MDDTGIILNVLKSLKTNEDVIRYCGTDTKIRRICKEYSKLIFGKTYNEVVYNVAINHTFPTLHHVISMDALFKHYKTYPKIWEELNKRGKRFGELPMCRSLEREAFEYTNKDSEPIDPSNPINVRYVAPIHRVILENQKKLTFLFFRSADKIPTNIFMLEEDEPITPYHFIKLGEIEEDLTNMINRQSRNFIHDKYNRKIWEKYIQDPYWIQEGYTVRSIEEEIAIADSRAECDAYPLTGFDKSKRAYLFQAYFELDHLAVEIDFDT